MGPGLNRPLMVQAIACAVLLVCFTWAGAAAQPTPAAPPARHVIVLSLDGARADAVQAAMPQALVSRGAVSWTAQTTFPSSTLPAHASMLSGVGPPVHRVTFNDWSVGEPYFARTTIFTEVTRAGGRAAALVAKPKMMFFMPPGSVASAQHLLYPRFRQTDVVEVASRLFGEQRPAVLFVHVADPDDVGHRRGWMSEEYLRVIAAIPVLIERLLRAFDDAGLAAQALLIVTSDHGGYGITHGTSRAEDMTIPWMAFGSAVRRGSVVERRVVVFDTAATALAALGIPIPGDWQGRPVLEALQGL